MFFLLGCAALLVIITAAFASFLYIVALIAGWAKANSNPKYKWISTLVVTVYIVFLVVMLLVYNIDQNMDHGEKKENRLSDVRKVLIQSSKYLATVSLEALVERQSKVKEDLRVIVNLNNRIRYTDFEKALGIYTKSQLEDNAIISRLNGYLIYLKQNLQPHCHWTSSHDNILLQMINTEQTQILADMKNQIQSSQMSLDDEFKSTGNWNNGVVEMQKRLTHMTNMVTHVLTDIDRSQESKQEWKNWASPSFGRRRIVNLLINNSIGSLLVVATIVLLSLFISLGKYLGKSVWRKIVIGMFIFVVLLAIITNSFIAGMSADLIFIFRCPLDQDNFGYVNMSIPFEDNNTEDRYICQLYTEMLSSSFGSRKELNLDFSQLAGHTHLMMRKLANQRWDGTLENLAKIDKDLIAFNSTVSAVFIEWKELIKTGCATDDPKDQIDTIEVAVQRSLENSKAINDETIKYVERLEDLSVLLRPLLDRWIESKSALTTISSKIAYKFQSCDISCAKILDSYENIRVDICEELDFSLDKCWYYLILMMVGFLAYLMIHAIIYVYLTEKENKRSRKAKKLTRLAPPQRSAAPKKSAHEDSIPAPRTLPLPPTTRIRTTAPGISPSNNNNNNQEEELICDRFARNRKRVRELSQQEMSDARSAKFRKMGPVQLHLHGVGEIPVVQEPEEEIVLTKVYYDPSGNEQYDIGSDVDIIVSPPARRGKAEEEQKIESTQVDE